MTGPENPYSSPVTMKSALPASSGGRNKRGLAISGLVLMLSPLAGMAITAFAMTSAFHGLGQSGEADPAVLAGHISRAMQITMYTMLPALIGVVLVSIVLFRKINTERWFYANGLTISAIWLIAAPPLSTVFGLYLMISFIVRRSQFRPTRLISSSPIPSH